MNGFYKTIKAILKPIIKVLFRLEIIGAENFDGSGSFMLCCNHQSFWDIVFLIVACPFQINFMAKKELFKNKILAYIFTKMGAFPINRSTGDVNAFKRAYDILENGGVLGIFPEGTRNDFGAPGKAKAGAAMLAIDTKVDILPVAIRYSKKPIMFKKVYVRVGQALTNNTAKNSSGVSKTDIRRVSSTIMENITQLWETEF